MLTNVKKGMDSMALAKETFLIFCEHFTKIPYHDLHKDNKVIQFFFSMLHEKNIYCNKAFQLALDVTYSRRDFSREHVLNNFSTYISFRNMVDPTDHTSSLDQSTLFTALQSKLVKEMYAHWEIVVNQTPSSNISFADFSPKELSNLEKNKVLTGNRFPDVIFNGIPYDYKYTKEISNTRNHVYIMPESEKAFKDFSNHINNLYNHIKNNRAIPYHFKEKMIEKLHAVKSELVTATTISTKHEIINDWNNFLMKIADQRPPCLGTSIFVVTNKAYTIDPAYSIETQSVVLAEGHLDQVKVKAAISGIIDKYPESLKDSIYQVTRGALSHVLFNGTND